MRNQYRQLFISLGLACYTLVNCAAEAPGRITQSFTLSPRFVQVKDQFNYGLVHRGINLGGIYSLRASLPNMDLLYRAEVGMGLDWNHGIGLLLSLKPLDGYAGFILNAGPGKRFLLGPYVAGYYMWQLYPELQSGQMFWFSSYEAGPRFEAELPVRKNTLLLTGSAALAGIQSRPEYQTESYYYSSTTMDFITKPHEGMTVGFPVRFNHVEIGLELVRPGKRFSLGYAFKYLGFRDEPSFQYVSQSIDLTWKIGTKKNKRP